ncbi:MAG: YaeQ family protein [Methylotenera sp.]|nr:YaeQ family protein [Oligoflexia bacterium]
MAPPSTLYRFRIDVSDVDRSVYDTLDFRVAMHPSESMPFLLTRVLAFALNTQEGLEFTPGGLGNPDEPCIRIAGAQGGYQLCIEIGNPSTRKLHKAAKASKLVKVYTYKDAEHLLREIAADSVYQADRIEVYSIPMKFLERLAQSMQKDNSWSLIHTDGSVTVSSGDHSEQCEIQRHT